MISWTNDFTKKSYLGPMFINVFDGYSRKNKETQIISNLLKASFAHSDTTNLYTVSFMASPILNEVPEFLDSYSSRMVP